METPKQILTRDCRPGAVLASLLLTLNKWMPAAQALVVQKQDPNELNNAARDFMVYFSLLMRIELMLEIVFKYRLKHWRAKSLLISYKKN